MANDDKFNQRQEQLINEFHILKKSGIQIQKEMDHNESKIFDALEEICDIQIKKNNLIFEKKENENTLPEKEKELIELSIKKQTVQ